MRIHCVSFDSFRSRWLVLGLLLVSGCGGAGEDSETLTLRSKYLSTSEPENAISLTEATKLVNVGGDAEADDAEADDKQPEDTTPANTPDETARPKVTLVGRVHAGDLDPWEPGKASFMISELPPDGHGEGHDSDNCPFCKRRLAKAPTGVVKFVADDGQTIPVDSRALFGLEKGQTVVVSGTLVAGEFNSIILLADKLHVRAP